MVYAQATVPTTTPPEIQFTSILYPAIGVYWGWGGYNLQGNYSLQTLWQGTNAFYVDTNIISSQVQNSSVSQFGVVNAYFEKQALDALGKFNIPTCESWITPAFTQLVQNSIPTSLGGITSSGACPFS